MTELRPIRSGDWPAIDRVQRAAFPPSVIERLESLRSIADAAPEFCLAAEADGEVVGYLLAHPWVADDVPELNEPLHACPGEAVAIFIHDMALLPSARGGGLASRMVRQALDSARRSGLCKAALISVQGTADFWARFGFAGRPELTAKFRARVSRFTEIPFQFMSAKIPG